MAEEHLVQIAIWTYDTFGPRQAQVYEESLIRRCEALAKGDVPSQSCSILLEHSETDLRFIRSGQHFVVFLEEPAEIIIVDFVHSSTSLPAKIAYLERKLSE